MTTTEPTSEQVAELELELANWRPWIPTPPFIGCRHRLAYAPSPAKDHWGDCLRCHYWIPITDVPLPP